MSIRMGNRGTNGHGQGKWHSRAALWQYKLARRKARKVSTASRMRNRV